MDEEQIKILEMVANKTITPEEGVKLLDSMKKEDSPLKLDLQKKDVTVVEASTVEDKPYENEEMLEVILDLGVSNFTLKKADPDKLYRVEYNQGEGFSHRVIYAHNELQVGNDLKKPSKFDIPSLRNLVDPSSKKCTVDINPDVKLYMKVRFGAGKSNLDFTGLRVKRLRLSTGASDTRMAFNELNREELDYLKIESGASNVNLSGLGNTNCSEMDINLGACNANLDFSGEMPRNLYAEISMRIGKVTIAVPENVGVKIKVSDRLADMTLPEFNIRDGYRVSKNIETAEKHLTLRIDTTLAKLNFEWLKL